MMIYVYSVARFERVVIWKGGTETLLGQLDDVSVGLTHWPIGDLNEILIK